MWSDNRKIGTVYTKELLLDYISLINKLTFLIDRKCLIGKQNFTAVNNKNFILGILHTQYSSTCTKAKVVLDLNPDQTDDDLQNLRVMERLQGHISSVRCLATSRSCKCSDGTNAMVLLSGGGRAQLMAWRIWPRHSKCQKYLQEMTLKAGEKNRAEFIPGSSQLDIMSTRWHHMSEQLANHIVIDDDGLRKSRTWKSGDCVFDPETRIMSMTVFPLNACQSRDM